MLKTKTAIKLRCLDCAGLHCQDDRCELYGMAKPHKGANRTAAIRRYCSSCMNGNRINECAVTTCSIYQYRAAVAGTLHVNFKPLKPFIEDEQSTSKPETGINNHDS